MSILIEPTDEELQVAVMKAKEKYSSTLLHTSETAAQYVRLHLGPKYAEYPTDRIRLRVLNLSRAGKEPGISKRSSSTNADSAIKRLIKSHPRALEHSEEYSQIHESEEYKRVRDQLKRDLAYTCQLCANIFPGQDLQGHIVDYRRWKEFGMLLILCTECHEVADALRRRGKSTTNGFIETPLFSEA